MYTHKRVLVFLSALSGILDATFTNTKAMKSITRYSFIFTVGGVGYAIIEMLWRGRTHPTMIFAGGISFVIISVIADKFKGKPLFAKAALSAVFVTVVELLFGVVFNMGLKMNVWDYSDKPLNFFGQICPLFTLIWGILAVVFIPLAEVMNIKIRAALRQDLQ